MGGTPANARERETFRETSTSFSIMENCVSNTWAHQQASPTRSAPMPQPSRGSGSSRLRFRWGGAEARSLGVREQARACVRACVRARYMVLSVWYSPHER